MPESGPLLTPRLMVLEDLQISIYIDCGLTDV